MVDDDDDDDDDEYSFFGRVKEVQVLKKEHLTTYYCCDFPTIWRFPEIGVPLNHPF